MPQQLFGIWQFVLLDDGVECHVHTCSELVGISGKFGNVIYTIACSLSCSEFIGSYVHGICPMINGDNALLKILGRGKKFNWTRERVVVLIHKVW